MSNQSFLSIQYVHGDLCKHLGIDSSTDRIPIIRIGIRIFSLVLAYIAMCMPTT